MSYRFVDVAEAVQHGEPAPRTSVQDIVAKATRIRKRRRRVAAACSGGAAAVVVTVVVALAGGPPVRSGAGTEVASAPSASAESVAPKTFVQPKSLGTTLGEYRVGTYSVGRVVQATDRYQRLQVFRDDYTTESDGRPFPIAIGTVTAYREGIFDPRKKSLLMPDDGFQLRIGDPEPVTVAGAAGFTYDLSWTMPNSAEMREFLKKRADDPSASPDDLTQDPYSGTAVAWEYLPGAWAVVVPEYGYQVIEPETVSAIAEALTPAPEKRATAPYRLGPLPDGFRVAGVTTAAVGAADIVSDVVISKERLTGPGTVGDNTPGARLRIIQGVPKDHNRPAPGQVVECDNSWGYCTRILSGDWFAEIQRQGRTVSTGDLTRILTALEPTDPADPAKWAPIG
ncbi:hypothetical protein [Actinoplanes couchii]|uniref:LigA n=1 Tax=Actinoplanes couchii TaxID=403638 RepID=A0ABQ3XDP9_9ACTN|nr:hypothetical protein [Actinoplanes couchii]MDR6317143.1 hypothetical protein [Actinoplanes couchii]GID56637.1 hypothetical protein Aco03nite_050410 [Actinoplanes couchii]